MYKNQLQELAQRSCFNLPSYTSTREGPDHAPRFKASVNFNGEVFESKSYSTNLRQAEHAAAEVALNSLSSRGPSKSLTARVLDETGVYKNLLQETTHRAGLKLPIYTTTRSGPGHVPVFTSTVELAGMSFSGEVAKSKKQAEKNAAIAAWSALKTMPNMVTTLSKGEEQQDHVIVANVLANIGRSSDSRVIRRRDQYQPKRKMQWGGGNNNNHNHHSKDKGHLMTSLENPRFQHNSFLSLLPPPPPRTVSKILPQDLSTDFQPLYHQSKSSVTLPQQVVGNSLVKVQEIAVPPQMDQHQRNDAANWTNRKISGSIKKVEDSVNASSLFSIFPQKISGNSVKVPNVEDLIHNLSNEIKKQQPMKIEDYFGNSRSLFYKPFGDGKFSTTPLPNSKYNNNNTTFNGAQRFVAPAVQIRSVIPVCAAPPPPTTTTSSSSELLLASTLSNLKL